MTRCRRTDRIAEIVADPALGLDALTEDQWAHVGICGDCHATVRGLERLDAALAAALRSRPYEDLPPAVLATPALPRRTHGPRIGPLLAAAAVVVLAIGAAALGGQWLSTRGFGIGADASPSSTPAAPATSPSADPTTAPSSTSPATPSATAIPTPGPSLDPEPVELAVGQVAAVVDEPLVVRTAPGTDPDSTITPDRLWIGQRVRILDGPADVDGYTWWEVQVGEIRGWVADAEADDSAPWLAPITGGRIWFWRHPGEGDVATTPELYSIRSDGSDEVRIGSPTAAGIRLVISCGFGTGPAEWSPDGSAAVFEHSDGGCDRSVFSIRADGSELRKLGDGWAPAWRPDGGAVAFGPNSQYLTVPEPDDGRLLVADPAGTAAPIGQTEAGVHAGSPSWSPNRTRIAFQRALAGHDDVGEWTYEIWVMDADGGSAEVLVEGLWPTWSPDGRWIVYEVQIDDIGTTELMRVRPDGGEPESLGLGRAATFSPDGSRLALLRDGGVWTMAPDGREASLAIPAAFVDGFGWSPDGSSLVVASDHPGGGATGISIVRLHGDVPAITGLVTGGHSPSWQPVLLDPRLAD